MALQKEKPTPEQPRRLIQASRVSNNAFDGLHSSNLCHYESPEEKGTKTLLGDYGWYGCEELRYRIYTKHCI